MRTIFSKMGVAAQGQVPFVLVLLAAVSIQSIAGDQVTNNGFKESAGGAEDQLLMGVNRAEGLAASSQPRASRDRLLAVPISMTRYMFPNVRLGDYPNQAAALMAGPGGPSSGTSNNKRSGASQFDALTGMSGLGKRSVPMEYINLDSLLRGQNYARTNSGRMQDMRWAPMEGMDGSWRESADY